MSYRSHPIHLVAGRRCLDFLNTANWNADGSVAVERLTDPDDFVAWCDVAGFGNVSIPACGSGLREVLRLRNALRSIVGSVLRSDRPDPVDLGILNSALASGAPASLVAGPRTGADFATPTPFTKAMAISAAALLTDAKEISRVKMCPGDRCGWHFVDESRNRRRQWCSMELCGNRAKARRFYHRHATFARDET